MRELRGSRKDLAVVFGDNDWHTAKQAAEGLGKPTGSIFGVLRRMCDDGLLEPDSPEPTRGTMYRLTAIGRRALDAALSEEETPGQLKVGQRLLFVESGPPSTFYTVLNRPEIAGFIDWSLTWGAGWLLALTPSPGNFQLDAMTTEFETAGFNCRSGQTTDLLTGAHTRERADVLARKAGVA